MNRSEQVAANPKEILDESMSRQESLYAPGGFEPAHLPFALSVGWLETSARLCSYCVVL